jgi:hypothetical protein
MDIPEIAYGVYPTGRIIMISFTSDNRLKNHVTGETLDKDSVVTLRSLEQAVVYGHNILVDMVHKHA